MSSTVYLDSFHFYLEYAPPPSLFYAKNDCIAFLVENNTELINLLDATTLP